MKTYPKLYIKKSKEKALDNRHSWIFSGAVARKDQMNEGDIIEIRRSSDETLAAYAFYTNGKSIVAKIFEHTQQEIDITQPGYWIEKIKKAYALRNETRKITTGYRLLYAEGDFLPGLIIDLYNSIAVVQTYNKAIDHIFDHITEGLKQVGIKHIFLKKTHENSRLQTGWITEPTEGQTIIEEYGIKFLVDIEQGQKTGFYIDQRENRKILEKYSKNKNVLNLFSYTGGFSLYALRGGASHVDSVDLSERAISLADKNVEINGFDQSKHKGIAANCFDFLKEMPDNHYDLIIIDPPAFAKTQSAVKQASRGYKELNLKAMKKIKSGGLIFTFSCSQRIEKDLFKKIVFSAAADAKRNIRIIGQMSQGEDHPINIFHPETEYLKGLILYVE